MRIESQTPLLFANAHRLYGIMEVQETDPLGENEIPIYEGDEKEVLGERCGIVAIYDKSHRITEHRNMRAAIAAGFGVQHRGQNGVGIWRRKAVPTVPFRRSGLMEETFNNRPIIFAEGEEQIHLDEPTDVVLLQTRYGTSGNWSEHNLQPSVAYSRFGEQVNVIHNGQFIVPDFVRDYLGDSVPDGASDTYLFTQYLARQPDQSEWDERIVNTLDQFEGAYSLGIHADGALYAARDPWGFRPLMLGKLDDDRIILASETLAIERAGGTVIREVKRGEVLKFDDDGMHVLREGYQGRGETCGFEWAYFSAPESKMPEYINEDDGEHPERWRSVNTFRYESGKIVGNRLNLDVDIVLGVPDSGVPFALGIAEGLRKKARREGRESTFEYRNTIFRSHYNPNGKNRLFQGDENPEAIAKKVIGKLTFDSDPSAWRGKRVLIADDSLVRANVSGAIVRLLQKKYGASEVHFVLGFPPITHTCHLGVSMRTQEELAAYRHGGNFQGIADEIGATSVNYISTEEFQSLIFGGKTPNQEHSGCGWCAGCCNHGEYPIGPTGLIKRPPPMTRPIQLYENVALAVA